MSQPPTSLTTAPKSGSKLTLRIRIRMWLASEQQIGRAYTLNQIAEAMNDGAMHGTPKTEPKDVHKIVICDDFIRQTKRKMPSHRCPHCKKKDASKHGYGISRQTLPAAQDAAREGGAA